MNLTDREKEIIAVVCKGFTDKVSAKQLFMSVKAWKWNLAKLRVRYGCSTTKELISYIHNNNLLEKISQKANRV